MTLAALLPVASESVAVFRRQKMNAREGHSCKAMGRSVPMLGWHDFFFLITHAYVSNASLFLLKAAVLNSLVHQGTLGRVIPVFWGWCLSWDQEK